MRSVLVSVSAEQRISAAEDQLDLDGCRVDVDLAVDEASADGFVPEVPGSRLAVVLEEEVLGSCIVSVKDCLHVLLGRPFRTGGVEGRRLGPRQCHHCGSDHDHGDDDRPDEKNPIGSTCVFHPPSIHSRPAPHNPATP